MILPAALARTFGRALLGGLLIALLRGLLLALLGGLLLVPVGTAAAAPGPPELSVRLECQRRPTPGRVLCEAEIELASGLLRWADVLVVSAPEFARPLRSRVGPSALFMKTDQRQRLQLALAATEIGQGILKIRARAVFCPDGAGRDCRALTHDTEARVAVGPITD